MLNANSRPLSDLDCAGPADGLERVLASDQVLADLQTAATEAGRYFTIERQRERLVGLLDEVCSL